MQTLYVILGGLKEYALHRDKEQALADFIRDHEHCNGDYSSLNTVESIIGKIVEDGYLKNVLVYGHTDQFMDYAGAKKLGIDLYKLNLMEDKDQITVIGPTPANLQWDLMDFGEHNNMVIFTYTKPSKKLLH
tara:strand:+ start:10661 stop:11056 length:396 start_codon:yes stop_codon:yes gene_type:complete